MQERGYSCSHEECDRKFRGMRMRYKIIKQRHTSTGNNRISWNYFQVMDDMFRGDPAVTPVTSVSSLQPERRESASTQPTSSASASATEPVREDDGCDDGLPTINIPTRPKAKKRPTKDLEPAWLSDYQKNLKEMHNERMVIDKQRLELEERRVTALEQLVKVLGKNENDDN
ncbi:uncharacterized protein LOC117318958 [Pecten maximus]|uniref:uncharacterized protein LOC117318958 n=1 Tax=Pecten maximus TaxID=6579 RepID=UPI00145894C0|nr:uncharacterized protein LOC117318958 [Pecten maximus]